MNIYGIILLIAIAEFIILVMVLSNFLKKLQSLDAIELENQKLRATIGELRLSKALSNIRKNPYFSSL